MKYMKYLNNFNYFINTEVEAPLLKEEVNVSIFENDFLHNHKDVFYTFCSLTHNTYPHGTEPDVIKYIKHNLQIDIHNNYFIKVGDSNTMFTSHLDSATMRRSKVKLLTYENKNEKFVSTDGKTILGADDKAGVTIMLYMLEHNIPGLYYFFVGEEMGGIGSANLASDKYNKNLKGINKCISFDRQGYNSIITHQMQEPCCSTIFANALCVELNNNGMSVEKDDTGMFTDSANFIDSISECTNISVGYFNEHKKTEYQNISFLEKLCKAVINVDWENLPVRRENYKRYTENVSDPLSIITSLKPQLAKSAQSIYDLWEQDEDGIDEMYGGGGICDDIASAMSDVIRDNTHLASGTLYNEYDTHTSLYVYDNTAKICFNVDIAPSRYEKGYGYTWTKKHDVTFTPDMIDIIEVDYDDYIDNKGNLIENS